jgi:hypothetical protein
MTYDPDTRTTEREVVVTSPGPSYGGALLAVVLVVLVILGAVWLFSNDGTTTSPTETTAPVETTIPTDTTVPAEAPTTP